MPLPPSPERWPRSQQHDNSADEPVTGRQSTAPTGIVSFVRASCIECPRCGNEQRLAWVHLILAFVRYERLPRAEKGVIRQHLQSKTRYSRAHITRLISDYTLGPSPAGDRTRADALSLPQLGTPPRHSSLPTGAKTPSEVVPAATHCLLCTLRSLDRTIRLLFLVSAVSNLAFVGLLLLGALLDRPDFAAALLRQSNMRVTNASVAGSQ
jgi:hypothetical protein